MPATALLTSEQYLALPDQFDLKNDQLLESPLLAGFSTPVSAFFELT